MTTPLPEQNDTAAEKARRQSLERQVFWFRIAGLVFWGLCFSATLAKGVRLHGELTPFDWGYAMGTGIAPLIAATVSRLFKRDDPRLFWQVLLAASILATMSNANPAMPF